MFCHYLLPLESAIARWTESVMGIKTSGRHLSSLFFIPHHRQRVFRDTSQALFTIFLSLYSPLHHRVPNSYPRHLLYPKEVTQLTVLADYLHSRYYHLPTTGERSPPLTSDATDISRPVLIHLLPLVPGESLMASVLSPVLHLFRNRSLVQSTAHRRQAKGTIALEHSG